jgi:hypothetical protein
MKCVNINDYIKKPVTEELCSLSELSAEDALPDGAATK